MKTLILIFAFLVSSAYAQVTANDPNLNLYKDAHTAASAVDSTGAYESQVTGYHNVSLDKSCPNCNVHYSLTGVDENGSLTGSGSSSSGSTSESEDIQQ